ncbi:MAG: hypothetical protein AAB436_01800 [Patescibacteria group bacterium]
MIKTSEVPVDSRGNTQIISTYDPHAGASYYQPQLDLIYHKPETDRAAQQGADTPETKIGEIALSGQEPTSVEA